MIWNSDFLCILFGLKRVPCWVLQNSLERLPITWFVSIYSLRSSLKCMRCLTCSRTSSENHYQINILVPFQLTVCFCLWHRGRVVLSWEEAAQNSHCSFVLLRGFFHTVPALMCMLPVILCESCGTQYRCESFTGDQVKLCLEARDLWMHLELSGWEGRPQMVKGRPGQHHTVVCSDISLLSCPSGKVQRECCCVDLCTCSSWAQPRPMCAAGHVLGPVPGVVPPRGCCPVLCRGNLLCSGRGLLWGSVGRVLGYPGMLSPRGAFQRAHCSVWNGSFSC